MKTEDAVKLLQDDKLQLTAIIWRFSDCPLEELNRLYVPTGKEEHVILAHKDDKYIPYRMTFNSDPLGEREFITLSIDQEFHLFIVFAETDPDDK